MASARDRSMENTIHDLKQPLNALRLKVHSLMQDTDGGNSSDVENTFEYLEGLIMSHLEQEKSEKKQYIDEGSSQKPSDLDLNEVLGSVHEMFLTDAQEKELEFRYVPTTMQTSLPSLVLMRLATNLVSNAIKYTASGKILLGCRRSGHMIRVEVHDTGTGMTEQQFSKAFRRKTRLDGAPEIAEGNGYGLSIVGELCQKHGLTISRCPDRTTGFGIAILIPACNP
jgi:signal transduction histidine kinase